MRFFSHLFFQTPPHSDEGAVSNQLVGAELLARVNRPQRGKYVNFQREGRKIELLAIESK